MEVRNDSSIAWEAIELKGTALLLRRVVKYVVQ